MSALQPPHVPWVGVSVMVEEAFRTVAAPCFADGLVDVVEWTVDLGFGDPLPNWCEALLRHYADGGRLVAHGVGLSLLSNASPPNQAFLERTAQALTRFPALHYSDHYGFSAGGPLRDNAPLSVPYSVGAVENACAHLNALRDRLAIPVGVENLAFAFSKRDALAQWSTLRDVLSATQSFLLLDLHNLYCQLQNFDFSVDELLAQIPLDRVVQIHLSGGSESIPAVGDQRSPVRRDTHDSTVPRACFDLLELVRPRCPKLKIVIVERLGSSLTSDPMEAIRFRTDLERIRSIVRTPIQTQGTQSSTPALIPKDAMSSDELAKWQDDVLARLHGPDSVLELCADASFARVFAEPRMVEIARHLTRKWGKARAN